MERPAVFWLFPIKLYRADNLAISAVRSQCGFMSHWIMSASKPNNLKNSKFTNVI